MHQSLFLFLILVLSLGLPFVYNKVFSLRKSEGYSNYTLAGAMGDVPGAQTRVLVQDTYPPIGKNQLSNDTANDIWQYYPVFPVGSYVQETNNIRYPKNPDVGRCMPASVCGALYHDDKPRSNIVTPLPPLNPNNGTRVGYFDTQVNMMPFRTDMQNILY